MKQILVFSFLEQLPPHIHPAPPSTHSLVPQGFPGGSVVKHLPLAVQRDAGDSGSVPVLGRSPGGGNGNSFQCSFWEIPWTEESIQSMRVSKSQI